MNRFGIGFAATISICMLGLVGALASEPVWSRTIGDIIGEPPQQSVTAEPRTPGSVNVEFLVEDRCKVQTVDDIPPLRTAPSATEAIVQDAPPPESNNPNAITLVAPLPVRPLPNRRAPIEISPSILYLP